MLVHIAGNPADPLRVGVRELGFGDDVYGRPTAPYRVTLSREEFARAIRQKFDQFVAESDADSQATGQEDEPILRAVSGKCFDELFGLQDDALLAVVKDYLFFQLLFALFTESELNKITHVINTLDSLEASAGTITLAGTCFERVGAETPRPSAPPAEQRSSTNLPATFEHAQGLFEQKVQGAQAAKSTAGDPLADAGERGSASANRGPENQDVTWRFDCGSENAPDNPLGMDSFVFTPDLRFAFDNRRYGVARRGTITESTHTSLLQWIEESGFPHVPDFAWIPGGDYYRLTRTSPRGEENVVIRRSAVHDFPGYGPLCVALDQWASVMRKRQGTDAPPGFTYDGP